MRAAICTLVSLAWTGIAPCLPRVKQAGSYIGALGETLRALGVILEIENAPRGLSSQRVRANPADIPRQPERN